TFLTESVLSRKPQCADYAGPREETYRRHADYLARITAKPCAPIATYKARGVTVVSMTMRLTFETPGQTCTVRAVGLNRRRRPVLSTIHRVPSGSAAISTNPDAGNPATFV